MVLDVLFTDVRHEKEIKGEEIGKEKVKLSMFVGDIILYTAEPTTVLLDYCNF